MISDWNRHLNYILCKIRKINLVNIDNKYIANKIIELCCVRGHYFITLIQNYLICTFSIVGVVFASDIYELMYWFY